MIWLTVTKYPYSIKKGSNTDQTKKPMGNAGAREEFALTASDKVTAVLLIYTVKYGKSIGSDRGKKKYTKKIKYPLSFEIRIFRFGQLDHVPCICEQKRYIYIVEFIII
jgi:hypothetical protein